MPLAEFFTGVRKTVLAPDELLVEFAVPDPGARSGGHYLRHTPRRELDIAVVGVASQLTIAGGVCAKARIALAAVAPTPVRATAAEQALEGQAVTPEAIERAAAARRRGRAPDQRSAGLRRVPPPSRPGPDPPHADDRARPRERLTGRIRDVAKQILTCTVNDEPVEVLVRPYDTLLDASARSCSSPVPRKAAAPATAAPAPCTSTASRWRAA